MLNRHEILRQTQEKSLVEWAKALNEARDQQVNQNAAGAAGTGSGGATGHRSLPNNTIPPSVKGYIQLQQRTFFVLEDIAGGNFQYQSYNYSTNSLSEMVDSGFDVNDFNLNEWSPCNDGSVLLMFVDNATGDDWRIVHVAPSCQTLTSLTIDGAAASDYYIDGVESNGSRSGLYFMYETENSSGYYDKHMHYFYNFQHYEYIATDTLYGYFDAWSPIMDNGLFFYTCRINDGSFDGYRLYRIGPGASAAYIEQTDTGSGQNFNYWNPYPFYTRDEEFAYYYDSYNPGYIISTRTYGPDIRSIRFLGNTAVWNLYTVLDNAITDLGPTGASIEDCRLNDVICAGDLLYLRLRDYGNSVQYTFILNTASQTLINAQTYSNSLSVSLHDMFNGAAVIITNDGSSSDNDFNYSSNVTFNIVWPNGDTDQVEYTNETRYMSGDIAKGGNVVTWFTKPAAGGQIYINRFQKGNLAPLQISIPGFTEANNDGDHYFTYHWVWDITQEKPVYALEYQNNIADTKTWLPAGVDGTFNIADKLVTPISWTNTASSSDSYGFHIYTQTDVVGTLNWYTLNLSNLKFELQFTDENSNYWAWDWDNTRNGFGEDRQKIIMYNPVSGSDTYIIRVIKNNGVVATDNLFKWVDSNSIGFTQTTNYSDSDNLFTITDTENLSVKQTIDIDLFTTGFGWWSQNTAVDRIFVETANAGTWIFSNDNLELIPANYTVAKSLYNDIWLWHY